jgi:putative ABC transport system permease protein
MPDWKAEVRRRIASLRLPSVREGEIVEELAQDAEDRYAVLVRGGMSPADAEAHLLADLDQTTLADALRAVPPPPAAPPVLGASRGHVLADAWQDLRYGLRMLRRSPLFAALSVITLTLGIGASTAMFSVVNAVLLAPLPFPDSDRLVQIWDSKPEAGWNQTTLTHANFWDTRDMARAFSDVGAMTFTTLNLTGSGSPERFSAAVVSVGFLRALGVAPIAGRMFAEGEDQSGRDTSVVMLSHRLWQTRFGADPGVVGRSLTLDGRPTVVVGVLPPGTPWLDAGDVFVPLVRTPKEDRDSFELLAIGRLKPGITAAQAAADLTRISRALQQQFPDVNTGHEMVVAPSSDWVAGETTRRGLWVLMGAVGCLLLIASVNLVNLLLAQATGRAREVALRSAIGAARGRIVRQLVVESLLLGVIGAALGLLAAFSIVRALRGVDVGIARLAFVDVDSRVLLFTVLVGVATSVATGLVSAFQSSQGALVPALKEGERGAVGSARQRRIRQVLVGAEVALAMTLLIGAGLLLRSFDAVMRADRGFQTEHRTLVQLNPPSSYNDKRLWQLMQDFMVRARAIPGVMSAAAVSGRPLSNSNTGLGIAAPGKDVAGRDVPWASWRLITPDYFRAMGVPLLRGRTFSEADAIGDGQLTAIISERAAKLLYPDQDPIGREMIVWKGQGDRRARIVGVVGNMRERGLDMQPTLAVYFPYRGTGWTPAQLVLNATTPTAALVPALRAVMASIDRDVPISDVQTFDEIVDASVASRRFTMTLLASFALLALLLALGGIYGVLAYNVARRTAEIGVRMALGAGAGSVLRLIVGQGLRPVLAGVCVGLLAAGALSQLMTGLLFGVTPTDFVTYALVATSIVVASVAACLVPARKAVRVDVMSALRSE